MDKLILDFYNFLINSNNINVVYSWMDIGDLISERQRSDSTLTGREIDIIAKLNSMLKAIKLENDIVLYRGITQEFNPSLAKKQFNAFSPNLTTAYNYGSN